MTHPKTRSWPIGRLALGAGLLLAALAFALDPSGAQGPVPKAPLPGDLKLVPADAAFFITLRVADLESNELVQKALQATGPRLKEDVKGALSALLVPAETIARATVVILAPSKDVVLPVPVGIIRTTKAYDRARLLQAFGPGSKETKSRGRTYHVALIPTLKVGPALYLVDEHTFVFGPSLDSVEKVLDRAEAKVGSGPLAGARLAASRKHHVVVGLRPDVLAGYFIERQGSAPPAVEKAVPDENLDKKGPVPPAEARKSPLPLFSTSLLAEPGPEFVLERDDLRAPELLTFRPLLQARAATLTLNVGAEVKLGVRLNYADADSAEDGETALRSALYVGRELLALVLHKAGVDAKGEGELVELFKRADASLRSATVERDKGTLRAAVSVKVGPALLARAMVELEKALAYNQSANNLKQIGIALHALHDSYGFFPSAGINDVKGKPLLSWRVAILPFIEQGNLYTRFRFDEPWDSEHNKKLLPRMPSVYAPPPGVKTKQPHSTFYRGLAGKEALFVVGGPSPGGVAGRLPRPSFGRRMVAITDGASSTLMVVEAGEAVPWTKPDDLVYDAKKLVPKLGGAFPEGFHALFADGAVRLIKKDIDEKTLRRLITVAGGEVIDWKKVPILRGAPAPW